MKTLLKVSYKGAWAFDEVKLFTMFKCLGDRKNLASNLNESRNDSNRYSQNKNKLQPGTLDEGTVDQWTYILTISRV